ncbi:MAG: tRNA-intron lyase [Euryarchaeota archaeon]|nr:tRNA-intron lyase [Euryarchaeota archaeon]
MPGELAKDCVIIRDPTEASQIYNKGYYGYPMSGGGLELEFLEALFLVESSRLEILSEGKPVSLPKLMSLAASDRRDFEIKYIVYRDLRQRGYIVKTAGDDFDFRVFPRGGSPTTTPTKNWVAAISERAIFDMSAFVEDIDRAERTRKELLLAVVDEEGDLTYYRADRANPVGKLNEDHLNDAVESHLLEDRVLVFDEAGAEQLTKNGHYGKQLGKVLQLSLIEAAYLMENNRLNVSTLATSRNVPLPRFRKRALKFQSDFELRLNAYRDLRSRGMVVKTGFKYGTHFRVYEDNPNKIHARFLVHCLPEDHTTTWPEMSRAVRLAHGVRKEILFAWTRSKSTEYLRLVRVRP